VPETAGSIFTEATDLVLTLFSSFGLATFGVLLFAVGGTLVRGLAKPAQVEFQRTWMGVDVLMSIAVYLATTIALALGWVAVRGLESLEQALPALALTAIGGLTVSVMLLVRARTLSLNLGWFAFGDQGHARSVLVGGITYLFGLPMLLGFMGVWSVLLNLLGVSEGQDVALMIEAAAKEDLVPIALLAALVIPWTEELFFRGALFGWLHKVGGAITAVVLSSILFAGIHGFVASGPILVLAFLLAFARIHSRGILACFVIHAMHNGLQVAVLHFLKP
tara:strand:- start:15266 stop:16099 length:834 start_codon:yes stop_codon:yes gene_type:complete